MTFIIDQKKPVRAGKPTPIFQDVEKKKAEISERYSEVYLIFKSSRT